MEQDKMKFMLVGLAALGGLFFVRYKNAHPTVTNNAENPWDISYFPKKIHMTTQPRVKRYPQSMTYFWLDDQNADTGMSLLMRGGVPHGRSTKC